MIDSLSLLGFGVSGFLVGFGAKLSNGCTSGHLFYGIPRRALRSLIAVIVYMVSAFAIAQLRLEEGFLDDTEESWVVNINYENIVNTLDIVCALGIILMCLYYRLMRNQQAHSNDLMITALVGFLLGFGMCLGGLNRRSKIMSFINFEGDYTILTFFVAVVVFNLISFRYLTETKNKVIIEIPSSNITWRLVIGSVIFGLGWGIGGLCPGGSFTLLIFITPHITFIWLPFQALGQASVILFEKGLRRIDHNSETDRLLNFE